MLAMVIVKMVLPCTILNSTVRSTASSSSSFYAFVSPVISAAARLANMRVAAPFVVVAFLLLKLSQMVLTFDSFVFPLGSVVPASGSGRVRASRL